MTHHCTNTWGGPWRGDRVLHLTTDPPPRRDPQRMALSTTHTRLSTNPRKAAARRRVQDGERKEPVRLRLRRLRRAALGKPHLQLFPATPEGPMAFASRWPCSEHGSWPGRRMVHPISVLLREGQVCASKGVWAGPHLTSPFAPESKRHEVCEGRISLVTTGQGGGARSQKKLCR